MPWSQTSAEPCKCCPKNICWCNYNENTTFRVSLNGITYPSYTAMNGTIYNLNGVGVGPNNISLHACLWTDLETGGISLQFPTTIYSGSPYLFPLNPTLNIELFDPFGGNTTVTYEFTGGDWNCAGPNTFTLVFSIDQHVGQVGTEMRGQIPDTIDVYVG